MRRRDFIAALGGAAVWPLGARAQQAGTPVIGFMSSRSPEDSVHLLAAFRQGLGETRFIEGQNVAIEFRWAQGQYQRLSALAADLVSRRVAVFTAVGGETSALAAKQATSTIPIVFVSTDPVRSGLVESYNRPGGNATGSFLATAEMEPKRLGLLHELVPGVSLIGALLNPNVPEAARRQLPELEQAARTISAPFRSKSRRRRGVERCLRLSPRAADRCATRGSRPILRYATRSDHCVRGTKSSACRVPFSRVRLRGRPGQLWSKRDRCLPAGRHLHRPKS